MQEHFSETGLLETRIKAQIFSAVAADGLVLAVLGLYSVIAYSVGQRKREIGIRMAVGASSREILRMVLLQGLRSSSIAALIGILFALAVSRLTTAAASHVNPMDTTIYAGVFLFLLIVTGAACYVPAYRASRVDPNITLRD